MDFLTLFAIYVVLVVSCILLVCKYSGQQQTPFGRIFSSLTKIISPWVPQWFQQYSYKTVHKLFHQRNRLFVYLHLFLEGVVYAEFSYEVFSYCREMNTSLASLCVPYVLLAVQSYFFYQCCSRDPGTVTKENHFAQVQVYQYDRNLFHPGVSCPTCLLVKPARSKHCRVCNTCVQRFDHHCVWINNCVGAQNIRHFLLYLVCLCAMAGDIAVLTADMLLNVVLASGLLHAHYVDQQGEQQPVGPVFIIQHLFLTFPRIIFMLGFLVFLFMVLAGYAMFHLYLTLVNQTSNEWSKNGGHGCQHCHPTAGQQCSVGHVQSRHFYSRGFLRNLGEIFWPLTYSGKKHK